MSSFKRTSSFNNQPLKTFDIPTAEENGKYAYNPELDFNQPYVEERKFNAPLPTVKPGEQRRLTQEEFEEYQRIKDSSLRQTLPKVNKTALEVLLDIGRMTKNVEIDDVIFSLRTLKSKENQDSLLSIFDKKNDVEAGYEIRRRILAHSLYSINNNPVEMYLGDDSFEMKLSFIDELDEFTTEKLYRAFKELEEESSNRFSFKTEKDAKEVNEALKK